MFDQRRRPRRQDLRPPNHLWSRRQLWRGGQASLRNIPERDPEPHASEERMPIEASQHDQEGVHGGRWDIYCAIKHCMYD